MKCKLITIILMLLLIPIATAMIECDSPMTPNDLPCHVSSTWEYPDCNTTIMKVYNWRGDLAGLKNFSDFGVASQRCNVTWNNSAIGSYIWNVSNGDTGRIIVKVEDNMLAIVIGLIAVMLFFIGMGVMNQGKGIGRFTLRMFGYGMGLIQIVNIVFLLYANEQGTSLISTLRLNFTMMLILAFGIGMLALIHLSVRLINPSDDEMGDIDKDKKW